ncbi:caspase family protein [Ottowia pentelensis]|uniref:caspase family protein n=1 Tax=Ottowia pentelensis TaxID=511108 RepID=UPI0036458F5A
MGQDDPRAEFRAAYRAVGERLSVGRPATRLAADAVAESRKHRIWHWLKSGLTRGTPIRIAVAGACAVILGVTVRGLYEAPVPRTTVDDDVRFRSLPTPELRAELSVRWRDAADAHDIEVLLRSFGGEVVGGPNAAGRWRVRVPDVAAAQRAMLASPLVAEVGAMMCSAGHEPGMRRCLRWLLHFLLLLPLLLGGANVAAARRALLIGVSELPGQPAANWLQAPRNDVRLMQRALLAQGWQPSTIQTLADGVPGAGSPDMSAIHAALGHLLAQSVPGDFVLLYFSGHGARVLDFHKQYREPDGLAEMFLARDGALRDVEIGRWVQAFLARGAFVWAVFDTCSAASMTRGGADTNRPPMPEDAADDPVRFRGLELGQLSAVARKRALAPIDVGVGASDDTLFVPPARYVAFFAAESHQTTPELRLPRGSLVPRRMVC